MEGNFIYQYLAKSKATFVNANKQNNNLISNTICVSDKTNVD